MTDTAYIIVNGYRIDVQASAYEQSLLTWLRTQGNMLSVRDTCTHSCSACLVEVDGVLTPSCSTKVKEILGKHVCTVEGLPQKIKDILVHALLYNISLPCGYCATGLMMKIYHLLQQNTHLTREEIQQHLGLHTCTCMGVTGVLDAVVMAQNLLNTEETLQDMPHIQYGGFPSNAPRFTGEALLTGARPFVSELFPPEKTLHAVFIWAPEPYGTIEAIDIEHAIRINGVETIILKEHSPFHAVMMPDESYIPFLLGVGDTIQSHSDILGIIVAQTTTIAQKALQHVTIRINSAAKEGHIPDIHTALQDHFDSNVTTYTLQHGTPFNSVVEQAQLVAGKAWIQHTQTEELLETPCTIATIEQDQIYMYTNVIDILWLRDSVCSLFSVPQHMVHCIRSEASHPFGCREDYLLAFATALCSYHTHSAVSMQYTKEEVLQHRSQLPEIYHDYTLALSENGNLIGAHLSLCINIGTGMLYKEQYVESIARNITGALHIPSLSLYISLITTHTTPRKYARSYGLEYSTALINALLDELSRYSKYNRYIIRAKNLLQIGHYTALGEYITNEHAANAMLEQAKQYYDAKPSAQITIAGFDSGLTTTNAMCAVIADVLHDESIIIYHPFPEYGIGLTTLIAQTALTVLGEEYTSKISIRSSTDYMSHKQTIPHNNNAMLFLTFYATLDAIQQVYTAKQSSEIAAQYVDTRYVGFSQITSHPQHTVQKIVTRVATFGFLTQVAQYDNDAYKAVATVCDIGSPFNERLFRDHIEGSLCNTIQQHAHTLYSYTHLPDSTIIHYILPSEQETLYTMRASDTLIRLGVQNKAILQNSNTV